MLRLPASLNLTIAGRFATTEYEDRGFDSDTVGANATIARSLSNNIKIGVGASFDDLNYKAQAAQTAVDFQRKEAFVSVDLRKARTTLSVVAGYSQIDGNGLASSAPLVRAMLTRRVSPSILGYLGFNQEYPTSAPTGGGSSMTWRSGGAPSNLDVLTSGPRLVRTTSAGFEFKRPLTSAHVSFELLEEEAQGLADHRRYSRLDASVSRRLGPRADASVFGFYSDETVSSLASDVTSSSLGASYRYSVGRSLAVELRLENQQRHSANILNKYRELIGVLLLTYGKSSAVR
jgi:hypothetical protein